MATQPLSSRRRSGKDMSPGCLILFFSVFLVAGLAVLYFMVLGPARDYATSRSWTETTCTMLSSQVGSHSDSDGTTYSVDVVYTYSVNGRAYQSDRFGFLKMSSSGRSGKEKTVARYPVGARVPCWVDPTNPEKAVLSRDLSWEVLFLLLPLSFITVGGGGMIWAIKSMVKGRSRSAAAPLASQASSFGVEPPPAAASGTLELRPTASPLAKFLGLSAITVFWNGIVAVFVYHAVEGWRSGQGEGCLTAFLVPFVLIGLLILYGALHQFLVLFNPRLRLTMSPGIITTGGTAYLEWRFAGRSGRVRRLRVLLEGREEARYRRGTSTYTDKNVFTSLTVIDAAEAYTIASGSTSFQMPMDTAPSFQAENNKIVWQLKVTCDIPGWPDSEDEYEIVVKPGGAF